MKAIRISAYGDASALQLTTTEPVPQPGPGQVLVRIHAAGVNFVDIYQRKGIYPQNVPFVPGLEASGVVEALGKKTRGFKPGDRVAYTGHLGSYSEYAAIDAGKLIPLPDVFSFEEGAAIPLQGMTAHYLINEYRKLKKGDVVLIHAAAGGVGLLLVQWAKHLGAIVIGTVSTAEKARLIRENGADHAILYTTQDFVAETKRLTDGRGAQLILDGVAHTTFPGDLEAVANFGNVVVFGAASGRADPVSPNTFMPKCVSVSGGTLFLYAASHKDIVKRSRGVLEGLAAGWLKLRIGHVLPLAQAAEAHRLLESRQSTGKIILKVVE